MIEQLTFYFLAGIAVILALIMITRTRALTAAIFFSFVSFCCAILMVVLSCHIEASLVILLIASGAAFMFIYVAVRLNISEEQRRVVRFFSIAASVAIMCMSIVVVVAIAKPPYIELPAAGDYFTSVSSLAKSLFGERFFEIEAAALMIFMSGLCARYLVLGHRGLKDERGPL